MHGRTDAALARIDSSQDCGAWRASRRLRSCICRVRDGLLHKAQAEGDPFGAAAPIKKEGEGEGGSAAAGTEDGDEDEDDENENGEDEGESDDLELSFQCFEVARLIYEKAGAEYELPLADVLESLGEVAMENEMWEDAMSELERSVSIKSRLLPPSSRQLAHLHYQLATATVAQSEKARHDAAQPPPPPDEAQTSDAPPPQRGGVRGSRFPMPRASHRSLPACGRCA